MIDIIAALIRHQSSSLPDAKPTYNKIEKQN